MTNEERAAILAQTCPNCQAPNGEPCNAPTQTGRRVVSWFHLARVTAARNGD